MTNEVSVAGNSCGVLAEQVEQGRAAVEQVTTWLTEKGIDFAIDVAVSVVFLLLGWLVIKIISFSVRKMLMRGKAKGALIVNFICSVVSKACWAVLLVMVLGRLGVDVAPLVAGLGVTGFIFGFAFQESLGNLASGLMIAINEPFKVGDFVDAAGHSGSVLKVDMMATVLATADNKKVVIPNKSVWGGPIVNYNAIGVRRVDLQVGIAYGEDVRKALEVITEAVKAVPGVLAEPAPIIAVAALADSSVNINVRPWTKCGTYFDVASDTLAAVKEALERAGIEIPFPQVVVHKAEA